ncbi:MAG TPA: A24 family peptidase [Woeseiaceae bacterium]|nr:A24 family peptidase [Woeseiaceae bacterium]
MAISFIAVLIVVSIAAFLDIRTHRIPNWLTYSACALGLLLAAAAAGFNGLLNSLAGFAAAFIPLLLMFIGGSVGGGDVKLMGAVGALLGFPAGLNALISSILVGGFCAAIILLWQGRLFPILRRAASVAWSKVYPLHVPYAAPPDHKDSFPFGAAIAVGTWLTVISIQLGMKTPAHLF